MQSNYNTETCRICLSNGAVKDIFDTKKIVRDTKVTCWEMMVYCFSTNTEYKASPVTKLCHKCYTKLVSAYKLKHLALDSEKNLNESLHKTPQEILYNVLINSDTGRKIEENEIKSENVVRDAIAKSEAIDEKFEAVNEEGVFIKNEIEFNSILLQDSNGSKNIFGVYLDENANADSSDDNLPLSHAKKKTFDNFHNKNNAVVTKIKPERKKKDHGRLVDSKKQSICDQCGKQVRNLKEHLRIHDANRRRISCEYCPKLFSTYSARYRHRAVQHLGKLYYCELCNKSYKSGKEHNAQVHSTRPRPFACLGCDKAFFTEAGLDIHMTVHTDEKRFECPVCQKRFRQKCTMVNHKRRIHDGEKSHICHHCSKAFFAIHHLQVHMRSHTKEKVYKCSQCQKMFSTTSSLHHHERRHTGEKRHGCQFCNMKFFDNGALKIHLISHTKEKKFECRYCGVKFGRSDHRNRHEKTAHQNKKMLALLPE